LSNFFLEKIKKNLETAQVYVSSKIGQIGRCDLGKKPHLRNITIVAWEKEKTQFDCLRKCDYSRVKGLFVYLKFAC
jgi:hypothetical protein